MSTNDLGRRGEVEDLDSRVDAALHGPNPYAFSLQEFRVLALITDGLADEDISARLGYSPEAVARHVKSILNKTGASTRTQVLVRALREHVIPASR